MTRLLEHAAVYARMAGITAFIITPAVLTIPGVHGQERQHLIVSDSVRLRTPSTISPQSGARGTLVTVSAIHLPAITPVQIGIGAIGTGFEVLHHEGGCDGITVAKLASKRQTAEHMPQRKAFYPTTIGPEQHPASLTRSVHQSYDGVLAVRLSAA